MELYAQIKEYVKEHDLRLWFHPETYVILNSNREGYYEKAIIELTYIFTYFLK